MRVYLFIFFLLFLSSISAQTGVQFTSAIPVANGTTYSFVKPKITLDADNDPVVLWGKMGSGQVFVSTFNGSGFNTPVQINPVGTEVYISSFYNADIKSNGDTIMVVFATEVPANRTYLVKSIDGGNTWGDTIRVDQLSTGEIAYFPSLDINEYGKVAVCFMRHDAGWINPRYVISTSNDGGNNFMPDTNASAIAVGEVCDCCPAEMIYKGNRQVMIFRNNDANTREFYASVSNDNGNSYSGLNIDNLDWVYPACPSVAPSAFISGDSLITVFMNGVTSVNRLYISTGSLSGMNNGNFFMVDSIVPPGTSQTQPQLAGKDSLMALVWSNTMPGESDVYFRFSSSGAAGLLGDGINITDTTGTQQNADIAYANGVFHIVYQNNPSQEVHYLKAIMDEYIGIEESADLKYVLQQNNGEFSLQLFNNYDSNYKIYDLLGHTILSSEIKNNQGEFNMNPFTHGLYWICLEGEQGIIKFYW